MWRDKCEPETFEDVVGHAAVTAALGRAAALRSPPHVLLVGSTGIGKTTLAKLYARAIFCEHRQPSGSPCGACRACRKMANNEYDDFEFVPPTAQKVGGLEDLNRRLDLGPVEGPQRVFLFDETGGSEAAYLHIKTVLDRAHDSSSVFIFTGNDEKRMDAPFKSRVRRFVMTSPTSRQIEDRLRFIADREEVNFEPAALSLLAQANRSLREAINDLQELHEWGPITPERVRSNVVMPRYGWLEDYFIALARGDEDAQLKALGICRDEPHELADRILGQLMLIRSHVRGIAAEAGDRFGALPTATVKIVADALEQRRRTLAVGPATYWNDLQAFWEDVSPETRRQTLMSKATRFNVRTEMPDAGSGRSRGRPTALGEPTLLKLDGLRLKGGGEAPDQLNRVQAQQIYEAASASLRLGAPFNTLLQLRYPQGGAELDLPRSAEVGRLVHKLQQKLARMGLDAVGGFHRVTIAERSISEGVTFTVVGHVPEAHQAAIQRWVAHRCAGPSASLNFVPARSVRERLEAHWRLVRQLWRGIDPSLSLENGACLLEVLEVTTARPSGEVECRRIAISERLNLELRRFDEDATARWKSAFRMSAWDWLFVGWEMQPNVSLRMDHPSHSGLGSGPVQINI